MYVCINEYNNIVLEKQIIMNSNINISRIFFKWYNIVPMSNVKEILEILI